LIIGGVRLFRSRDGGSTFNVIAGNVHSDWHSAVFDPADSRRIVATATAGSSNRRMAVAAGGRSTTGSRRPSSIPGSRSPDQSRRGGGRHQGQRQHDVRRLALLVGVGYGDSGYAMIDYTNPNTVLVSWQGGQLGGST
jgi:hypothetical protein